MSPSIEPPHDRNNGQTKGRWKAAFARLGIRESFLFGFGIMCAFMMLVVTAALFTTARIGQSASSILDEQLPVTLEILRATRAVDAFAATGAALVSATTEDDRRTAFERADSAQAALEQTLNDLASADATAEAAEIHLLSEELTDNLLRLRDVVDGGIALVLAKDAARTRVVANLQAFQQQLTYRIRIMESDSDIIGLLMAQPVPPTDRVAAMAQNTAPLIPLARFYAEVESIGGRLLASAQDPSLPALHLSEQVLAIAIAGASSTFARLPEEERNALQSIFKELQALTTAADGPLGLRERELTLYAESQVLNLESQQITRRVDATTADLVQRRLDDIRQAGASATSSRQRYIWLLILVTAFSLLGMMAFMRLHVMQHLVARLSLLSQTLQNIAAGRFDIALPEAGSDELGRLGAAVQQFHTTAIEAGRREAELQASNRGAEKARRELEIKAHELESLNSKLADLSTQDFLTGLANRRRFDEALGIEWARGTRTGQLLALIMIDVDHFKPFNDRYGHQAGDDCLRQVATMMKSVFGRVSDLASRYGGEEFCVIVTDSTETGIYGMAERVRTAVEKLTVEHTDSPYGVVTVSIGVATVIPGGEKTSEDLLRAADAALYDAKANGRNRVMLAQMPT